MVGALVDSSACGRGGALLVADQGLVSLAERLAHESEVGVIKVSAAGSDREPFGLIRRMLRPMVEGRSDDDPVFAGVGGFAWRHLGPGYGLMHPEDRETQVYGLAWLLLTSLEETGPTLFLIQAPESADEGSLRILQVLARQARDFGPAMIVASEPGQSPGTLGLLGFEHAGASGPVSDSGAVEATTIRDDMAGGISPDQALVELDLIDDLEERTVKLERICELLIEAGRPEDAAQLAEREIARAEASGAEPATITLIAAARASRLLIARRERAVELTRQIAEKGTGEDGPGRDFLGELALEKVNTVSAGREAVVSAGLDALGHGSIPDEAFSEGLGWFFGCYALHLAERNRDALAVLDRAVAAASRRHSLPEYVRAVALRSGPLFHLGYCREAAADCEIALAAGIGELEVWLPAVRSTLVQIRTWIADTEGAKRIAEAQDALDAETAPSMLFRFGRACLYRVEGRQDLALDDLREAGRLMSEGGGDNPATMPWRSCAAILLAGRGDAEAREEALELADREVELARTFGSSGPIGMALFARAMCETGPEHRVDLLRGAVASHRRGERMVERLEAEVELGSELNRIGQDEEARELLRSTLHLAHLSGADLLAERARAALVAAGGKPRREARTGPGSLTPAERRIVDLAAAGFTNPEIAGSLFLTVKTIEWHLTRAYSKLEIGDRAELAAALTEPARGFRPSPK